MKYLIVNADDFGASPGINRGILDAHHRGILTSASLLVDTPWSKEAAVMSRTAPGLSVGLHVAFDPEFCRAADLRQMRRNLDEQLARFEELTGGPPTHLDAHHNVHRDSRLLPHFLNLARRHGVPLRDHSPVRCFSQFYGQWAGESHPEQISVPSLVRMLETNIEDGITEMTCHPGYLDSHLRSSYAAEREFELQTLCAPVLSQVLEKQSVQLTNYRELANQFKAATAVP